MDQVSISRELLRQVLVVLAEADSRNALDIWNVSDELRTLLDAPAVEPYGHVTVRRLSQRFENHVDQYQFYPAGHPPYLDNADECVTVYTAPQAQQPRSTAIAECLQVLRPTVEGKFPQEQALEELVGYLSAPQAQPLGAQQPKRSAVRCAGKDVRKAVKLTTDEYTALAHRIASKYTHRSDPAFTGYTFLPHTLEQFVRAIEQAVWEKLGVTE